MRHALLLGLMACALPGQSLLSISPAVITQCTFGHGRATVSWNAPQGAIVQIRIGSGDGVPMTGLTSAVGTAETGNWIDDGMIFVLVNGANFEYARITAHVNCGGAPDTTGAALIASSSYLPLQVGNQWIYRTNSRVVTSSYKIQTLTRTVENGGDTYFVLETRAGAGGTPTESLIRSDDAGRMFVNGQVVLDPAGGPARQKVEVKDVPVDTPAGKLPVGLLYQDVEVLSRESGAYARGLGLLNSTSSMSTGSSGGFLDSVALVESRIGSGLYFTTPAVSVELGAENTRLDVTGKQVTNCAVPCYFVACGFAPGADPPNTYKPCFQARVRVGQRQCSEPVQAVASIDLRNAANQSVYSHDVGLTLPPGRCDSAAYHQVPLYTTPNVPFATGAYRLNVRVTTGGDEVGTASVPLRIE
jgi:hypothetical protein